jgi:hypothetical protein
MKESWWHPKAIDLLEVAEALWDKTHAPQDAFLLSKPAISQARLTTKPT